MVPRWYPPIGRPIGTPPRDTHITWPWRLRPAVSYQSSGAASAPGGNTPRALYGAGADGHPEAPDRRPLGACPYRRQCAECSPSKFIDGLFQTVMGAQQHLAISSRDACPVGRFPDIEPDDGFRHSNWCHGGILQSVGRSEPLPATPTLPGRGACARQFPISRPERRAPPVATPPGPSTGQGQTAIRRRPIGGPSGLARIVGNAPNARHRNLSMAYFRL